MIPAGHHSYSDSTLPTLPKSAITLFGVCLQGLGGNAYLAAGLILLYLYLALSFCLSFTLSISLIIYLTLALYRSLSPSISLSLSLIISLTLSIPLSLSLSLYLSLSLSLSPLSLSPLSLSLYLSLSLSIKELVNRTSIKNTLPQYCIVDREVLTDKHVIANRLNTFFTNIGPKLASQIVTDGYSSYEDFFNKPNRT